MTGEIKRPRWTVQLHPWQIWLQANCKSAIGTGSHYPAGGINGCWDPLLWKQLCLLLVLSWLWILMLQEGANLQLASVMASGVGVGGPGLLIFGWGGAVRGAFPKRRQAKGFLLLLEPSCWRLRSGSAQLEVLLS